LSCGFRASVAALLMIAALTAGSLSHAQQSLEKIPDFSLKDINGKAVSMNDFRGKLVLINFWATWCGPCLDEMGVFRQVEDQWRKKGLVVLLINMGESASRVRGYVKRYALTLPVLLDPNMDLFVKLGVRKLPTSLLIDGDGTIVARKVGAFLSTENLEKEFIIPVFGKGKP
jgi:thiol-disulfide isomerase/thioredoxin